MLLEEVFETLEKKNPRVSIYTFTTRIMFFIISYFLEYLYANFKEPTYPPLAYRKSNVISTTPFV